MKLAKVILAVVAVAVVGAFLLMPFESTGSPAGPTTTGSDLADSTRPPVTQIPEYAQPETPPPKVSITCPPDGYGNEITFGGRWEVFTPEATVRINYGDGRAYKTSRLDYFDSAYRHTYHSAGTFLVKIALTDGDGRTDSSSCTLRVLPELTDVPPYNPPSYPPGRLPDGHIDHDWPTNPGPGSSDPDRPIQPYPTPPGDYSNDRDRDGVSCEYGCKN